MGLVDTIAGFGQHDSHNLVRVNVHVGRADAVTDPVDANRLAIGRDAQKRHIVDAFQLRRLDGVDLENDFVGQLKPQGIVADGGRGDELALLGNARYLDNGAVHFAEKAGFDLPGQRREQMIQIVT